MTLIHEDLYVNISSSETVRRVYVALSNDDEELDGRYLARLFLSAEEQPESNGVQRPSSLRSNEVPEDLIDGRDMQQITLTGKMTRTAGERRLSDVWLNSMQQTFLPVKVSILYLQEYLIPSMK